MSFDDELRRMFADFDNQAEDRLDVPVRPDASQRIVAGANRLRKRRAAMATASGVLAVAVLVGGGILLASPEPDSTPPAMTSPAPESSSTTGAAESSRPPSSDPAPPSPPPRTVPPDADESDPGDGGQPGGAETSEKPPRPVVTGMRIGPDGFGPISLGMTYEELLATGAIQEGEPPAESGCAAYEFTVDGVSGYVHVSAEGGAQAILPTTTALHTADGVSTEWTVAQVGQVYPEVTEQAIVERNPVPVATGTGTARYLLAFVGDALSEITLQYADQPCF